MPWWVLELITAAVLLGLVLFLGPLIKRFGKTYAAEVFRSNPGTGKSFIVLTDFAYYLIFIAYVLFTSRFEAHLNWEPAITAHQLKHELARLGGLLLIMGVLHSVNLLLLPIVGRLLTLNRQLQVRLARMHNPD
jgi:hypothetical protein